MEGNSGIRQLHDRNAPYWAAALIVSGTLGVLPGWIQMGEFWSSYGLDIFGPVWNYILFRQLYTAYRNSRWRQFFNPWRTLIIFIVICYLIEGAQYLEWYDATFDPWDLLAYVVLLIPVFMIDLFFYNRGRTQPS